jgi:hypothetical protein
VETRRDEETIRAASMKETDEITGEVVDAAEPLAPVHSKQLLPCLRLLNLQVGLLINFGAATLKEGPHRVVNRYTPSPSASPRLRVIISPPA